MSLTDRERRQLFEKLEELKVSLAEDIKEAHKSSRPVELDQTAFGRVSRIDAIQQQQMQASALTRMEQRLSMVEKALSRIDDETFGECTLCEEPIVWERLLARPESPLCVICAQRKDQ